MARFSKDGPSQLDPLGGYLHKYGVVNLSLEKALEMLSDQRRVGRQDMTVGKLNLFLTLIGLNFEAWATVEENGKFRTGLIQWPRWHKRVPMKLPDDKGIYHGNLFLKPTVGSDERINVPYALMNENVIHVLAVLAYFDMAEGNSQYTVYVRHGPTGRQLAHWSRSDFPVRAIMQTLRFGNVDNAKRSVQRLIRFLAISDLQFTVS